MQLAAELPATGNLESMGNRLVERLEGVFEVDGVSIFISDPESRVLVQLASTVEDRGPVVGVTLLQAPDDPGLRMMARSGRPLAASDLAKKSPELGHRLDRLDAELLVPLVNQGLLIGLLMMGPKRRRSRFLAEEIDLLGLLGHHVSAVFENARLFESATRDRLTGLLRRESILDALETELERAQRYRRPFSIGLGDLDHFKRVNDRHGHLTGDRALSWVGQVLINGLRSTDLIGRYGGEEFLFILPETELESAILVSEKVRMLLAQRRLSAESGEQIEITISIGLASFAPSDENIDATSLLADADRALYQAKGEGRNLVRPATEAIG